MKEDFRRRMNRIETTAEQSRAVRDFLGELADAHPRWPEIAPTADPVDALAA